MLFILQYHNISINHHQLRNRSMATDYTSLFEYFKRKINILVIDDEDVVLDVVTELFYSPIFKITTGSSLDEAIRIISRKKKTTWHCWIVDVSMRGERDGLKLIEKFPTYPFTVVLSGLQSMTVASEASEKGAMKVFDKNPQSFDLLLDEVCKIAALGYILKGKYMKYIDHFSILKRYQISSKEEWAKEACISIRQLERVCAMNSRITPLFVLHLYYSLYYFLKNGRKGLNIMNKNDFANGNDFYYSHLNYLYRKFDRIKCNLPS